MLGGASPLDPASVEASKDDVSVNFFKTKESLWKNTAPLSDFIGKAEEFDAIFYVGGHGRKLYSPHFPPQLQRLYLWEMHC